MEYSGKLRAVLVWLTLGVGAPFAAAQTPGTAALPGEGAAPAPITTLSRAVDGQITVRAVRLDQPLKLDGILDEEMYRTLDPATDFIQQVPNSGLPATENTEVWVFFDDRNIYISLRCLDSRPGEMVANEMRRDNQNIWMNDNVIVVLDTFHDRRTAFFFQTNPIGGVRDALVIDDGVTNYDWNTVWDVKSRRLDTGWTTEMAIPFKSLRYRPSNSPVWGFNVLRVLRGKNEQSLLSPVPASYNGNGVMRLASAATLVGIEPPPRTHSIEIKPYALSTLTTNRPAAIYNDADANVGVDAKYGLTSSMFLDFTYNTDFAQVEIDEQQVNLTRFSLLFPEKRDFFLEGQSIFDFAGSGGSNAVGSDPTPILFFSRRIGLSGGGPVPIQAGGRLMGRMGRLGMGMLNIQTKDAPGAEATNFSVVRMKRDVLRRSNVGLLFTDRRPATRAGGSNRVYGADANMSFLDNVRVNGFYARSATPAFSGDTESYRGRFQYVADRYGLEADRLKVGNQFNPEVGLLRRSDFRRTYAFGRFSPRPKASRFIRKLTWQGSVSRYRNSADVVETQQQNASFHLDFHNSDILTVDYFHNYEFLAAPFKLAGGLAVPPGSYRFNEFVATYLIGPQRIASGTLNFNRGSFYNGDRTQIGYTGRVKFSAHFAIEPRASTDWVSLPQGKVRLTLFGARPTLTITPRMFVSALVQYNSSLGSIETNARWRWEYQPGSDLFVVYTDGRDTTRSGFPELVNRGLAVKFTRFLRF